MKVRLNIPMSALEVATALGCPITCDKGLLFYSISTDSRELVAGELFIALDGTNTTGELFIEDALSRGGYTIGASANPRIHFKVQSTKDALLNLAEYYKQKLRKLKYTIAITGSIGKTTTKELAFHILKHVYRVHRTPFNYNNEIGVPLTILSAPKDTEILLVECGMNHRGEISRLSCASHPDIALITNIGTAHIGNLGSREAIAEAKSEIIDGMHGGIVLCDADEPLLRGLRGRTPVSVNSSTNAAFRLLTHEHSPSGTTFDFHTPSLSIFRARCPHNIPNLMSPLAMALSLGALLGMEADELKRAVLKLPCDAFRHKIVELNDFKILDDSYNASLESVIGAIKLLQSYDAAAHSALIGDILELGERSEEIHHQIGQSLALAGLKHLFIYGNNAKYVADGAISSGFPCDRLFINNDLDSPHLTATQIIDNHVNDELILFKASHATNLVKILALIKEKYKNDGR